jgi:glycerol uptake facilitator-like aquaporin
MRNGPIGNALEPARAFASELACDQLAWTGFWVWIVGPLAGATPAAVLYEGLYPGREEGPGTAELDVARAFY